MVRTSGAKLRIQLKSNWIFSLFHLLLFIYIYIYYTNLSLLIGIKKKFNPQLFTISFLHFIFSHLSLLHRISIHSLSQKKKKKKISILSVARCIGPHVSMVEILIESSTLGPIVSKTYLKSPFVLLGKIFNMHENRFQLYPSQSAINNRLIGKQF